MKNQFPKSELKYLKPDRTKTAMMYTAPKRIIFMNLTFRVLSQSQLRSLYLNLCYQKTEKRNNHQQQGGGKKEQIKFSKIARKILQIRTHSIL